MKNSKIVFFILFFSLSVFAEEQISGASLTDIPDIILEQVQGNLDYTWSDFLTGKSCSNFLSELPEKKSANTKLNQLMRTYCPESDKVWNNLLVIFRQNKKDLLISETLKENHSFVRYLKVIPLLFFDIHHTQIKGQTLTNQLDELQNAIQNKDPEQILFLIQNLSPSQQLFLMPVFDEAGRLANFKKLLQGKEEES